MCHRQSRHQDKNVKGKVFDKAVYPVFFFVKHLLLVPVDIPTVE